MYAPNAPRSLMSYHNLRANGIHITTTQVSDEEVPELKHGLSVLATAKARANALYEIKIKSILEWIFANLGGTPIRSRFSPKHLVSSAYSGNPTQCGAGTPEQERPLVGAAISGGIPLRTKLNPRHLASSAYSMEIPARIQIWHTRIGHLGTTMLRCMISTMAGHMVCLHDAREISECASCSQGKFLKQPSKWKLPFELPAPLQRLQGDICGPITPASGPFCYFLVLVDASGRHAKVSLLSTRNMVFSKLLAMIIKIKTHYPNANIQILRMDNAQEFKFQTFKNYYIASQTTLMTMSFTNILRMG